MTSALMPFDSLLSDERDANPDLAAATLNPDLLNAVPQPVQPSISELRQALEQQKVVIVRLGPGLSWQSIFSGAAAVLLHLSLIGGIILLSHVGLSDAGGTGRSGSSKDAGGKGHGVVGGFVIGPGEPRPGGTTISPKPALIPEPVKVAPAPIVPPAPVAPAVPAPSVQTLQDKLTSSEVVGLPTRAATAKPAETQPVHPQIAAATPPPLMIAPPAKVTPGNPAPSSVVASASSAGGHRQLGGGGAGGAGRGGSRLGQGPGLNDEDEEGYDLMKSGSGSGSGKNRGASAADQNVKVLDVNPFLRGREQLSNRQLVKLSGKSLQLRLLVRADGSVGDVKVMSSSGIQEVDDLFVQGARNSKFMPAMRAGRAIDNTYDMSMEF